MNDLLWPIYRITSQPQALHCSYEKAGLVIHDQPIPWNAEAVLVEAALRLPVSVSRRKGDFQLRLAGKELIPTDNLRRIENDERHRVQFRLPPPGLTVTAELLYRNHVLGQLSLPFLTREEFLQGLRLQMTNLFVRLGTETVACQTFVANQCTGLLASAVLTSPTSLVPLVDLDLQVEFRSERDDALVRMPVRLSSSQLAGRQALITVAPRKHPRRLGAWSATWLVADRLLASQRIQGISQRQFIRSLRISDTRFVFQEPGGALHLVRQTTPVLVPGLAPGQRLGPCFLVSSSQVGMAGRCAVHVTAQVPGSVRPPLLLEQEVLITDGPAMVAPGTLDAADLAQVSGFELRCGSHLVGTLPLSPAPAAHFTSEGGFRPPTDYQWSAAAEEEMTERLNRLLEGRERGA